MPVIRMLDGLPLMFSTNFFISLTFLWRYRWMALKGRSGAYIAFCIGDRSHAYKMQFDAFHLI